MITCDVCGCKTDESGNISYGMVVKLDGMNDGCTKCYLALREIERSSRAVIESWGRANVLVGVANMMARKIA